MRFFASLRMTNKVVFFLMFINQSFPVILRTKSEGSLFKFYKKPLISHPKNKIMKPFSLLLDDKSYSMVSFCGRRRISVFFIFHLCTVRVIHESPLLIFLPSLKREILQTKVFRMTDKIIMHHSKTVRRISTSITIFRHSKRRISFFLNF